MSWARIKGKQGPLGAFINTRCVVCGGWALKWSEDKNKICECSPKVCARSWKEVPGDGTLFVWKECEQKS